MVSTIVLSSKPINKPGMGYALSKIFIFDSFILLKTLLVFPLTMAPMQDKVYCEYFRCFRCLCLKQFYLKCRFSRDRDQDSGCLARDILLRVSSRNAEDVKM